MRGGNNFSNQLMFSPRNSQSAIAANRHLVHSDTGTMVYFQVRSARILLVQGLSDTRNKTFYCGNTVFMRRIL
jgi:hypothetical protein